MALEDFPVEKVGDFVKVLVLLWSSGTRRAADMIIPEPALQCCGDHIACSYSQELQLMRWKVMKSCFQTG